MSSITEVEMPLSSSSLYSIDTKKLALYVCVNASKPALIKATTVNFKMSYSNKYATVKKHIYEGKKIHYI